ncbi:response regulator [Candidatus Laterigemmans baculatus]|uniref:hypothetical protein n=1 Tax=Candidatus Laterigemmans baculatus TaxID=2770505 RepID=UPI0013DC3035|nr:hypothetical protein [Candidatus Laterigemmans baculatus]
MPQPSQHETMILVVDPNPITLIATAGALDSHGYACICARTAVAAEKAAAQDALDAVVIEVADDAEAALALVAKLREVSGSAELPVLLVADGCWAGLQQRCEALAAVRCLFKPIDPNALLDLLQHSLWMPPLPPHHRRRGTRPNRPGWVSL